MSKRVDHPQFGEGAAGRQRARLIIACATRAEAAPLRPRLARTRELELGRRRAWRGEVAGVPVLLLPTGVGKTNTAQALTVALERGGVLGVLCFGVAGAYTAAGVEPGGVVLATSEAYGDEGVEAPGGWLSTEEIGFPLLERPLRHNAFPLSPGWVERAGEALRRAGISFTSGSFVTVSACSGTEKRGVELARRFGALAESMEGAAAAHLATLYGIPFLEVRAISNLVEDRDRGRWQLEEACAAAAAA
ncbi:MAG: futalosine hydrolase, partial [Longimicrobiaceae bacterium]